MCQPVRVTTSIHGSPKQYNVWEPRPRRLSGGAKSHHHSLVEVRSTTGSSENGEECGCCTAVHLHSLHLGGVRGGGRPPRTLQSQECGNSAMCCKGSLWRGSWGSSVAVPSVSSCFIIQSRSQRRMTSPKLLDTSYGFPRTGQRERPARLLQAAGTLGLEQRARQTAKQLYKHRSVPSLVCLITDVRELRNNVIKDFGYDLSALEAT